MLLNREEIVIFSNWKCSLPVNELGCEDKLSKSAIQLNSQGNFHFDIHFLSLAMSLLLRNTQAEMKSKVLFTCS